MAVQKDHPAVQVNVKTTPQGYYNIERMIKSVAAKGEKIKACGTCADAPGIRNLQLVGEVAMSNMADLAAWTVEADKVFTF